jgi:hypothetical protein
MPAALGRGARPRRPAVQPLVLGHRLVTRLDEVMPPRQHAMFSRSWPEPPAHWLVLVRPGTLPRPSRLIARPLNTPLSTGLI